MRSFYPTHAGYHDQLQQACWNFTFFPEHITCVSMDFERSKGLFQSSTLALDKPKMGCKVERESLIPDVQMKGKQKY